MNKSRLLGAVCACVHIFISNTPHASLIGRAPVTAGGTDYQAYFDTALNITWTADANLAATETFGVSDIYSNGQMSWSKAGQWIGAMNTVSYLGVGLWRLPSVNPLDGASFNYTYSNDGSSDLGYNITAIGTVYDGNTNSELSNLYYYTLGNYGYRDVDGNYTGCAGDPDWCLTNSGPFSNIQYTYWYDKIYVPNTNHAWDFLFSHGYVATNQKTNRIFAWAVADGDVFSPVPIPASVWLFGSGLLGLVGMARRNKAA